MYVPNVSFVRESKYEALYTHIGPTILELMRFLGLASTIPQNSSHFPNFRFLELLFCSINIPLKLTPHSFSPRKYVANGIAFKNEQWLQYNKF